MIGAFARKLGKSDRILSYEQTAQDTIAVQSRHESERDSVTEARDAPPEAFVERLAYPGGDVYMVPLIEAMRQWFKRRRGDATDDAEATTGTQTVPRLPEKHEGRGRDKQCQ